MAIEACVTVSQRVSIQVRLLNERTGVSAWLRSANTAAAIKTNVR